MTRRRFLAATLLSSSLLAVADAKWLEPNWVKTRHVRLGSGKPSHRFVQFTDVHHKGDRGYLQDVVSKINALSPEFVCFTGDLIEHSKFLKESLDLMAAIKSPMYGIPGNHDYWSKVSFDPIAKCFAGTGGGWLLDQSMVTQDGNFSIVGATCLSARQPVIEASTKTRRIFLMHYPGWVKQLGTEKYDLILAGHSHGGQVRLPVYGPLILPFGVDKYDLGMFQTVNGPLYVNPGIGWFPVPIRFNCRPEITVFEL
ncbi:MAG TPA: metallophosphoesterase [Candidatus Dormibacteraeota bacterium]|nr:metallophosphoesterase [Candidatus Dormibacteraeota bacterium]